MNSIFGHSVLFYNLRLPNRGYKTFNNVLTAAKKKVFVPASHREFYRRAVFCFRVYCLIINTEEASKSSLKASSVYIVVSGQGKFNAKRRESQQMKKNGRHCIIEHFPCSISNLIRQAERVRDNKV